MNQCINCNEETNNPKFCCRSCAAKYNNKAFPKRLPEHECFNCNKKINSSRRFCSDLCKETFKKETRPLQALVEKRSVNKRAVVRFRQQQKLKAIEYKGGKCKICGYDKCPRALDFHHIDSKILLHHHSNSLKRLVRR